jgi:O-antigen/teichoic acid export membrane protein
VMFGIGNILVPAVAQSRAQEATAHVMRLTLRYGAQGAVVLLPYYALLILFPKRILSLAYGSASPYTQMEVVLRLCVVASACMYLSHLVSGLLYGLRRTVEAFHAQLPGIAIAFLVGLPLTMRYGAAGACAGVILVYSVRTVMCYRMALKHGSERKWSMELTPECSIRTE